MNNKRQPAKPVNPNAAPAYYLLTSLFLSGACSLALEVVGTRLISPFYGSSIYTWSALITTTLLALAFGYALKLRAKFDYGPQNPALNASSYTAAEEL